MKDVIGIPTSLDINDPLYAAHFLLPFPKFPHLARTLL